MMEKPITAQKLHWTETTSSYAARLLHFVTVLMTCVTLMSFSGCGSGETTTHYSAEERFQRGKVAFDDENYLDAINEFTVVTLQYQGSEYADDARYYLGECRFNRGEYRLAASEYMSLRQLMPASPLVPDAQYKLALSYYELSPKATLDQQDTKRAIEEFQTFVEYYPNHSLVPDAEAKIQELTSKLALKAYNTAKLYATMEYYRAATMAFDDVIEKYHDTEYAPPSYLGKVESLIARNKYDDAQSDLRRFYERFPNSVLRSAADRLQEKITRGLEQRGQVTGKENSAQQGGSASVGTGTGLKGPR